MRILELLEKLVDGEEEDDVLLIDRVHVVGLALPVPVGGLSDLDMLDSHGLIEKVDERLDFIGLIIDLDNLDEKFLEFPDLPGER